jgi:hypothetical protein
MESSTIIVGLFLLGLWQTYFFLQACPPVSPVVNNWFGHLLLMQPFTGRCGKIYMTIMIRLIVSTRKFAGNKSTTES